jgi:hypothetical protein
LVEKVGIVGKSHVAAGNIPNQLDFSSDFSETKNVVGNPGWGMCVFFQHRLGIQNFPNQLFSCGSLNDWQSR